MKKNYGATPGDWDCLSLVLGLTEDLLPVVSNPNALISPDSKMQGLGKTPSKYNRNGKVAGISGWTGYKATPEDITNWSSNPDYGACLQMKTTKAIDIDIEGDTGTVDRVLVMVKSRTGLSLPLRHRANSSKCLLLFRLPLDMPKRVIRLKEGIIEFLATGQQAVVSGTHTSGARYEWQDGMPTTIPDLSLEEFEALWAELNATFGTEESTVSSTSPSRAKVLSEALTNDPVAQYLIEHDWVKSSEKDGRLHIRCPFEDEHTSPSAISATTYFPANTGGYQFGHFACLHAHCDHRTDDEFKAATGAPYADPLDDFEVITSTTLTTTTEKAPRFTVIPAHEFAKAQPQSWIVKGVLPKAELGVVYGESGSGKSFWVLDLVASIARGEDWRGHRVTQGSVVYIAAEGSGGMRARLRAYADHHAVSLEQLPIGVIADAPNFMLAQDIKSIIASTLLFGAVSVIVVDTFAQVMSGANENSGEDVGKALSHCRQLHKYTGALVLLIHHSGKDAARGARGWSGTRAACDVEIEIVRCDDDRVATLTKMKDGIDGTKFGFKLRTTPTGAHDEDGDPITSCIIECTNYTTVSIPTKKEKELGKVQREALVLLADLTGSGGDPVEYIMLREALINSPVLADKSPKTQWQNADQAVKTLVKKNMLVEEGGFLRAANYEEGES